MKKVLLMTLALTMCAGAAMADHIGIYSDQGGLSCALTTLAPIPGNNTVYIVHKYNTGSAASQFKVTDTSGLIPLSQTTTYLSLGTWNADLSLSYGGCAAGDLVLMTLSFFWGGVAPTCANTLEIAPAPTSPIAGSVALVECDFETVTPVSAGRSFFGPGSDTCPAGCNEPSATNTATWGSIKALYR